MLEAIRDRNPRWSLDDFVDEVNRQIALLFGQEGGRGSVQPEVNPRLVRHYTSLGLVDRPERDGKEARYRFRHLLQMLVLRRLLKDGVTAQAIAGLTRVRSDEELAAMLESGARLTVEPLNPAMAFLQQVRARTEGPGSTFAAGDRSFSLNAPAPTSPTPRSQAPLAWERYPLEEGLELHVRSDFAWPGEARARNSLIRHLIGLIEKLMEQRRSRS